MLSSKNITLRLVEESDAEFIVSLRVDDKYNKYLSSVSADIDNQKSWIKNYKAKEANREEFYFIIERNDGTRCGTVRLYDFINESFCWGSWILNEDKGRYSALESALLVYEFGFDHLGFKKSHFEVVKGNSKVIDFHIKFGAIEVAQDDINHYYEIDKQSIEKVKKRFSRIINK